MSAWPRITPVNWDDYDRITLTGVKVHGKHGVLPEEKTHGHTFSVDARLWVDTSAAGRSDDLKYTVNYAQIAAEIESVVAAPSVDLIETLAEGICGRIFATQVLVRRVEVSVNKPTAPIAQEFSNVQVSVVRTAPAQRSILALGSNMGDSRSILSMAREGIGQIPGTRVLATSEIYETDPVGGVEQDPFLNAAVLVETVLSPWDLHRHTSALEQQAHRVRDVRWGPRTLDIDVITWGDFCLDDPALTLPHPRAHERGFVLAPLSDLDGEGGHTLSLPGYGTVAELLDHVGDAGVRPGPAIQGFGHGA